MNNQVVKHINDLNTMHKEYMISGKLENDITWAQKRIIREAKPTDQGMVLLDQKDFDLFVDHFPVKEKPKVMVVIEGGLVQEIYSDSFVEVIVIDNDTEGADEDKLVFGHDEAFFASSWEAELRPAITAEMYDLAVVNPIRFVVYDSLEDLNNETGLHLDPLALLEENEVIVAVADGPDELTTKIEKRAGRGEELGFANVDSKHYIAYRKPNQK